MLVAVFILVIAQDHVDDHGVPAEPHQAHHGVDEEMRIALLALAQGPFWDAFRPGSSIPSAARPGACAAAPQLPGLGLGEGRRCRCEDIS